MNDMHVSRKQLESGIELLHFVQHVNDLSFIGFTLQPLPAPSAVCRSTIYRWAWSFWIFGSRSLWLLLLLQSTLNQPFVLLLPFRPNIGMLWYFSGAMSSSGFNNQQTRQNSQGKINGQPANGNGKPADCDYLNYLLHNSRIEYLWCSFQMFISIEIWADFQMRLWLERRPLRWRWNITTKSQSIQRLSGTQGK